MGLGERDDSGSALHCARHNARHNRPFCEFRQDMPQLEDALSSEDAMNAPCRRSNGCSKHRPRVAASDDTSALRSAPGARPLRRGPGCHGHRACSRLTSISGGQDEFEEVGLPRNGARAHPRISRRRGSRRFTLLPGHEESSRHPRAWPPRASPRAVPQRTHVRARATPTFSEPDRSGSRSARTV